MLIFLLVIFISTMCDASYKFYKRENNGVLKRAYYDERNSLASCTYQKKNALISYAYCAANKEYTKIDQYLGTVTIWSSADYQELENLFLNSSPKQALQKKSVSFNFFSKRP